jgi:predicted RNA-binding protein YlqC (UPF0109 family)
VSRARNVVEVVARALAATPDEVHVTEFDRRGMTVVELSMAPGELGRVMAARVARRRRSARSPRLPHRLMAAA